MSKNFIIHDLIQGTQEWMEFREGKIGGSDAASILGVSPWETKLQCWERFVFGIERKETPAMTMGKNKEAEARDWLNQKLQKNFQPAVLQNKEFPEFISSLDGFYIDEEGRPNILEIKHLNQEMHFQAVAGFIPDCVNAQLQHALMVSGGDLALYLSCHKEDRRLLSCHRDEEYIENLKQEERAFLQSTIDINPPEPCDKDWVKISDLNEIMKAEKCVDIQKKIKELTEELDQLKGHFKGTLTNKYSLLGSVRIQRIVREGSIDYKKMAEDHLKNIDTTSYKKKNVEMWRFY